MNMEKVSNVDASDVDFEGFPLSITDIEKFLPEWRTKLNKIHHNISSSLIEITFSIAARSDSEVQQWLREYEEKTKCTYSIRTSKKCEGVKVKLKQILHCHHNTRNEKMYIPSVRNRSKNTNCPSAITVTLKTVRKNFRGKDKSKAPNPDMPCEIKLIPCHNHETSSADALRFRRVSQETKEKLVHYYESGHSPATALELLKMDLQMKHNNFHEIIADRSVCPDYMYCYNIFIKLFKAKSGVVQVSREYLERKVEDFNEESNMKCAGVKFINEDYVICFVPPLMQRVHETIEEASEIVFLDSETLDHRSGNRIFILLTASDCGGLPLAIFITSSESCRLISVGFQMLKEIMGNRIFHGSIDGPALFMTDDSAAEHAAIQSEWPKSTNLLCTFYVLQSIWRWLIKAKNGIRQEHQHKLFQEFRKILYANTEDECEAAFHFAQAGAENYPEYQTYLNKYWDRRRCWALCFRDYFRRGHNTNNISEAAMRLLKEKIFDRIKAFNFTQVIQFMLTKFVDYYERTLLDAAHNRTRQNVLHCFISLPPTDLIERIQHVTDNIYAVPSESVSDLAYIVNSEVLTCTCNQGRMGRMCKHISWVCCSVESDKFIKRIDNDRTKKMYYFIATGNQPSTNWLEPIDGESSQPSRLQVKPNTNYEDDSNPSSEPAGSVMETEENREQILSRGKEVISELNEQFFHYLKRSPREVYKALEALNNQLKKIKTVSGFTTSCRIFSLEKQRMNRRSNIPVQPTANPRHKNKTNLPGKRSNVGRRPRQSLLNRNLKKQRKAPFPAKD